jgi:hypothetical protein
VFENGKKGTNYKKDKRRKKYFFEKKMNAILEYLLFFGAMILITGFAIVFMLYASLIITIEGNPQMKRGFAEIMDICEKNDWQGIYNVTDYAVNCNTRKVIGNEGD